MAQQEKQLFPRPAPTPKPEEGMLDMVGKAFSLAQTFMQGQAGGVPNLPQNPNAGQMPFNPASLAGILSMIPPQMMAQMPQILAQVPQMQQMFSQFPQMQAQAPQMQAPAPQFQPQLVQGVNGNGHATSLDVDRKILACLEQLSSVLSATTKSQEMLLTQILDAQKLLLEIQKNNQKNLDSINQIPEMFEKAFSEFDDRQKKWTEENSKAFQDVLNSSLRQFFK